MAKMKAALYMRDGKLDLKEVDIPPVSFEKIRIKIKYCAMCATDAHVVFHNLFDRPAGFGLGHELSGVIEELGEGLEKYNFKVGDKVVVFPLLHCGKCEFCKRGQTQYCIDKSAARFPGFAEYAVCHVSQVYKIPNAGDLKGYSLVEPMTCAIRGIDLAGIRIGQNVAVSGVGGIGLILLNMILLQGGANVTAIDPVASKRETALRMGAAHVIDPIGEDLVSRAMQITGGQGFDVIFEASGAPSAAPPCLKMVANCGTVMYFGVFPMNYELPVNLFDMYSKEARILTAFVNSSIVPRAIQLVPRMNMDIIIGKIYPLEEIQQVFEDFKKSIYPKILVEC
jgi:(R,R)-butanediol dehydrogenase/meso-butanediol dehydrogenase/diacetyl reductase